MTGERLELFHAEQRNPLHYALAGAALMGFLAIPTQLIERHFAPEPVPKAQHSPAPVWSKRCESQGRTYICGQADGGKWVCVCTGLRV